MLIIIVTDNGLGIPKENLDRIFQPFFTTKEPGVGTGLGLSVSHKIINSMSGSLSVIPKEVGTRFQVTLPIIGAEKGPALAMGLLKRIRQRRDSDPNPRHILLVEKSGRKT